MKDNLESKRIAVVDGLTNMRAESSEKTADVSKFSPRSKKKDGAKKKKQFDEGEPKLIVGNKRSTR